MAPEAINVRNVPEALRSAVHEDMLARSRSLNDTVVTILARRYGVTWEPSGYGYTDAPESEQWTLRLPAQLMDVLRANKREVPGATMTGLVLNALSDHYGLPFEGPRKRGVHHLDVATIAEARRRNERGESLRSLAKEYGVKRETLTKAIRAA